jgi:hypothetical protein
MNYIISKFNLEIVMKTETTVASPVKLVKVTCEFTVPVNTTVSILGGRVKNAYSRDQQYARFYLNAALRKLGGRITAVDGKSTEATELK